MVEFIYSNKDLRKKKLEEALLPFKPLEKPKGRDTTRRRVGRPVGIKRIKLSKSLERFKISVADKMPKLFRAQLRLALGQMFVYKIVEEKNDEGKILRRNHVLVEDKREIAKALDEMEENGQSESGNYYYITTKEPSNLAIQGLMDRAFGRAKETVEVKDEGMLSLRQILSQLGEKRKDRDILEAELSEQQLLNNENKQNEQS